MNLSEAQMADRHRAFLEYDEPRKIMSSTSDFFAGYAAGLAANQPQCPFIVNDKEGSSYCRLAASAPSPKEQLNSLPAGVADDREPFFNHLCWLMDHPNTDFDAVFELCRKHFQAQATQEPDVWRRYERDETGEGFSAYSEGQQRPHGIGWQPLYTQPDLSLLEAHDAKVKREGAREALEKARRVALTAPRRDVIDVFNAEPTTAHNLGYAYAAGGNHMSEDISVELDRMITELDQPTDQKDG